VVSKNGNLLLNIGPRADGTIPEAAQATLLAIGSWLEVNGEAIYGSRPWTQFGEGPTQLPSGSFADKDVKPFTAEDFRFTTHGGSLYAIELGWPASGEAVVHALAGKPVRDVALLGYTGKLHWRMAADGLHVALPPGTGLKIAYTLRITM
jgi:alpha-L-fucosidase